MSEKNTLTFVFLLLAEVPKDGWLVPAPYLLPLRLTYTWLRRQEKNRRSQETAWQEAKKAQATLRLNEEFLNTVIDNIPAMIFVKDARGLRFVRFNQTGAKMLGYT